MAKAGAHQIDVLVLGEHPAAYLTAALLKSKANLKAVHSTIPGEPVCDRLTLINPEFFELCPMLQSLRRKLELEPVHGVQFLSDSSDTRSEHRAKSAIAFVGNYRDVRNAVAKACEAEDVRMMTPTSLEIHAPDEHGIDVHLDGVPLRPKMLVVGGALSIDHQKTLGLPDSWGLDVVHRVTFVSLDAKQMRHANGGGTSSEGTGGHKMLIPMSLDLRGNLFWAWALPHGSRVQITIEQPVETTARIKPNELLKHWIAVLKQHGVLNGGDISMQEICSLDLPLAGALAHEGVANRTLLVGPAGGFFSATGEDLYPNCWSALFAVEVIKKAIRETHLQDALQPYRHKWRTTLGDYLRGPQQNLRFLLPLVYRNQVMTTRLAEAILQGKSVVR